jgi:hypothetical protein
LAKLFLDDHHLGYITKSFKKKIKKKTGDPLSWLTQGLEEKTKKPFKFFI